MTSSRYSSTISAVAQAVTSDATIAFRICLGAPPKNTPEMTTFVSATMKEIMQALFYFALMLTTVLYAGTDTAGGQNDSKCCNEQK